MNSSKYKYEYRKYLFAGTWKHSYELIGQHGGLNFHVSEYNKGEFSAGLEVHYRQPKPFMDRCPSQVSCWLLKTPCWHEGTTLYAEEHILPYFDGKNHDLIFNLLTGEADLRFESEVA